MLSKYKGESVLDRAGIESNPPSEDLTEHEEESMQNDIHLSKRKRLSGKVKSLLHVSNDHMNVTGNADCVTLAASPDAVSGESRLDESKPPLPGPQGFQQLVQHPIDAVKAKTQRKTNKEVAANLLSPEVTHGQSVGLIRAQDTLDNAQSEDDRVQAYDDLETLKKARQDLFVRWTMDRHVLKLKRLEGRTVHKDTNRNLRQLGWKGYSREVHCLAPSRGAVIHQLTRDGFFQLILQQAEKYGGHYIGAFSEPPTASQETVSASVERLLIASSPWQELTMHARRIYRWENQKESTAYLVAFLFLWAYGALSAVAVSQIEVTNLLPLTIDGC